MPKVRDKRQISQSQYHGWSNKDKKLLLAALQKHGSEDLQLLSKELGNRNVDDIRNIIRKFQSRAESEIAKATKEQYDADAPINKWKNILLNSIPYKHRRADLSSAVGQMLHEAAKEYPDVKDQCEPNFQRIYMYLGDIMFGRNVPTLSPLESAIILQLFRNLLDSVKMLKLDEERKILQTFRLRKENTEISLADMATSVSESWKKLMDLFAPDNDKVVENTRSKTDMAGGENGNDNLEAKMKTYFEVTINRILTPYNPLMLPVDFLQSECKTINDATKKN